jgi:hypothetical protein
MSFLGTRIVATMSSSPKRMSILLKGKQIDFLDSLAKKIEKEGREKMSRCQIVKVLTKTLTCMEKVKIGKCKSEEEIEREFLKCFEKGVKKLKGP